MYGVTGSRAAIFGESRVVAAAIVIIAPLSVQFNGLLPHGIMAYQTNNYAEPINAVRTENCESTSVRGHRAHALADVHDVRADLCTLPTISGLAKSIHGIVALRFLA